jgi:hypothetical protein
MSTSPSPADLRALAARLDVKFYMLAAHPDVATHPSRLSQYLHGRIPLPDALAQRIREALETWPRALDAEPLGKK